MGKVFSLDVDTPANANAPSGGAAIIRLLKNAIHERHNQDHYWEKSGTTIDADDVGYHRKATLLVLAASPAAKADAGILYSLDVNAKAELHYRDEDGNVVQITSAGRLINCFGAWNAGAPWVKDTSYLAATDGYVIACHTGGQQVIGYTDAANPPTTLRGYGGGGANAGSFTFPVRKGDYWKVAVANLIFWMPSSLA